MGDSVYLLVGIAIAIPFWAFVLYLKKAEDKRKFDKYYEEKKKKEK